MKLKRLVCEKHGRGDFYVNGNLAVCVKCHEESSLIESRVIVEITIKGRDVSVREITHQERMGKGT